MDEEETFIKQLLAMRDSWERQIKFGELKSRLVKRLGISLQQAEFLAKQMLGAAKYKAHVGNMVTLPFGKALFERETVAALLTEATKAGDTLMVEMYTKALQEAPQEVKAQDAPTPSYSRPSAWEVRDTPRRQPPDVEWRL